MSKTDGTLGNLVHAHLVSLGIETPYTMRKPDQAVLQKHFLGILQEFGLDMSDDSLTETPKRMSKMFNDELFVGLDYENFPKATVVENKMSYDEMLIERNIQVYSVCEHHVIPIVGKAHVAYIPESKVVGLSKLNRIVDFFCRRPQIQERLTAQIFHTLQYVLETENVAIILHAEHMCVKLRGVEDACSDTVTSKLGGVFRRPEVRQEFIALSMHK